MSLVPLFGRIFCHSLSPVIFPTHLPGFSITFNRPRSAARSTDLPPSFLFFFIPSPFFVCRLLHNSIRPVLTRPPTLNHSIFFRDPCPPGPGGAQKKEKGGRGKKRERRKKRGWFRGRSRVRRGSGRIRRWWGVGLGCGRRRVAECSAKWKRGEGEENEADGLKKETIGGKGSEWRESGGTADRPGE